jgi:hypothetical protein
LIDRHQNIKIELKTQAKHGLFALTTKLSISFKLFKTHLLSKRPNQPAETGKAFEIDVDT